MKSFAVCNKYFKKNSLGDSFDYFDFNGHKVLCGLVEDNVSSKQLLPLKPEQVLIKIKAFSCNYRDRSILLNISDKCKNRPSPYLFAAFGSDFVAEVVACGSDVVGFKEGDRIIPDCSYPHKNFSVAGIPTNYASQRYHKLNYDQIIKIPNNLTDEKAAAFSIGAQTSYSIIRKLNVQKNDNILITAATSNTSLFALMKLKNRYDNIYVISSRSQFYPKLHELGVKKCIKIKDVKNLSEDIGGFDVVIDPFYDLHFNLLLPLMNDFGRYISCGLYMQHHDFSKIEDSKLHRNYNTSLVHLILKNISFIGNCLGKRQDIEGALKDYENGDYDVLIDTVYTGSDLISFLKRTYINNERFGKVIYRYND